MHNAHASRKKQALSCCLFQGPVKRARPSPGLPGEAYPQQGTEGPFQMQISRPHLPAASTSNPLILPGMVPSSTDLQIHSRTYGRRTTGGKHRGLRSRAHSPTQTYPRALTFTLMLARAPMNTAEALIHIWASWVYSYMAKTEGNDRVMSTSNFQYFRILYFLKLHFFLFWPDTGPIFCISFTDT